MEKQKQHKIDEYAELRLTGALIHWIREQGSYFGGPIEVAARVGEEGPIPELAVNAEGRQFEIIIRERGGRALTRKEGQE